MAETRVPTDPRDVAIEAARALMAALLHEERAARRPLEFDLAVTNEALQALRDCLLEERRARGSRQPPADLGLLRSFMVVREALEVAVDRIENLLAAAKMPLPPKLHLEGLMPNLASVRDGLTAALVAMSGDDAPDPKAPCERCTKPAQALGIVLCLDCIKLLEAAAAEAMGRAEAEAWWASRPKCRCGRPTTADFDPAGAKILRCLRCQHRSENCKCDPVDCAPAEAKP